MLHTDLANDRSIFSAIWKNFRAAGWTSKPPKRSNLCDLYRYIPLDGNPNGVEGADFFLGEGSLLECYRKSVGVPNHADQIDTTRSMGRGETNAQVADGTTIHNRSIPDGIDLDEIGDSAGCLPAMSINNNGGGGAAFPGNLSCSDPLSGNTRSVAVPGAGTFDGLSSGHEDDGNLWDSADGSELACEDPGRISYGYSNGGAATDTPPISTKDLSC
ncbi:hypothetical protein PI124_g121 [Phytophthora idaei]|nr:hypothetical protein PI125_g3331 [Phytophthora idaei]KAG3165697.1 hypothetical protein PI126_g4548 [Phytophthora idaei]KAG3255402.1 hypothetical protein PI124_g121 [Phytophthora idaei]